MIGFLIGNFVGVSMDSKIQKVMGYGVIGLILFVATMIVIRWVIAFVSWTAIDSGWAQAIGSILAIIAAFLVADRQFQMSRRESRVVAIANEIRRIEIIRHMFLSVIPEAAHFRATAVGHGFSLSGLDPARILELRDTFKSLPLLDAPTSDLAGLIAAMPIHIDGLIKAFEMVRASEQAVAAAEVMELQLGTMAHRALTVDRFCWRALTEADNRIDELKNA